MLLNTIRILRVSRTSNRLTFRISRNHGRMGKGSASPYPALSVIGDVIKNTLSNTKYRRSSINI